MPDLSSCPGAPELEEFLLGKVSRGGWSSSGTSLDRKSCWL